MNYEVFPLGKQMLANSTGECDFMSRCTRGVDTCDFLMDKRYGQL